MSERRQTSQIQVGKVGVGSDYPVSVQSMTTTKTRDTDETLGQVYELANNCLLYTSPSPRDATLSRMPSSA